MQLRVSEENLPFFEALASPTRLAIIDLLGRHPMNIRELAEQLGISSSIVARHITQLEQARVVRCERQPGRRGEQKVCRLDLDAVALRFSGKRRGGPAYRFSVPVGVYASCDAAPTCGLAGRDSLIGILDDPRTFDDPAHTAASLLWFGSGFVEYALPNYLVHGQAARSLKLSFEICSEAPGYREQWPSAISFDINGVCLGTWISPGDFGRRRGALTPDWYTLGTQYGLLKTLTVNRTGSYLDGVRLSGVTLGQLRIIPGGPIALRIRSGEQAPGAGGVTLFGRYFGNYAQDIDVCLEYGRR